MYKKETLLGGKGLQMALVLVGLPPGLELVLRLDLHQWQIRAPPTQALALTKIPTGMHLLAHSFPTGITTHSQFIRIEDGGLVVALRWDQEGERLVQTDHSIDDISKIPSFPLPDQDTCLWSHLSRHISKDLLNRILDGFVFDQSTPSNYSELASSDASSDLSSDGIIRFTPIDPRRHPNPLATPTEITSFSTNKTPLLDSLLQAIGSHGLLGEFQLAFLILAFGHNFEGYQQWARILQLLASSTHHLAIAPIITAQLECCPEEFFQDLLHQDNLFILRHLQMLASDNSSFDRLKHIVRQRFGWSLDEEIPELDEDLPTIVE